MDPVSNSFSIAKTVGEVSWELYKFSKDVRNNNRAIGDLASELFALNRAVAGINSTLEKPSFQAAEQCAREDSNELWSLVRGNLNDTYYTLKNFEQLIRPLLPEQGNMPRRVMRTFRFNLGQPEITSYRTRIQGHVSILNITLQTLTLRATYLAPDAINGKIMPAIRELQSLIERRDTISALPPEMAERVKKVRAAAAKEVTSASTIYTGSTRESIDGRPMPEHQRRDTLRWISEAAVPDEPEELLQLPTASTVTARSNSKDYLLWSPAMTDDPGSAAVTTPTSRSGGSAVGEDEEEEDPQESFQADLVQKFFQKGTKLFNEKKYPDAQRNLQKGLKDLEKLPVKLRDQAQLRNVQMMLAQCACHSPDLNEAERRLTLITREEHAEDASSAHEDAIRRCQAMHLLSAVLLREGKFPAANKYCKNAIAGRRKLLGKEDISYYESVHLLAQITEADGTEDGRTEAENILEMIPEDVKPKLTKVVDEYPMTPALRPMSPPSASPMAQEEDQVTDLGAALPSPSLPPTEQLASFHFAGLGEPAVLAPEETKVVKPSSPEVRPRPPPSPRSQASGFDPQPELQPPSRLPPTPDERERKPFVRPEPERRPSQPQPDTSQDYFNVRSGSEAGATSPPPVSPSAVRTPSVVSDNSSAASADGEERRRSSWKFFSRRRSSQSKTPSSPNPPARVRTVSTPGGATGVRSSPLLQPSNPPPRFASVDESAVPRENPQSMQEWLLERIEEESGRSRAKAAPEYPGLF